MFKRSLCQYVRRSACFSYKATRRNQEKCVTQVFSSRPAIAKDQIPSQTSPRWDTFWKSDTGTHWDIGFFPKPVHGGYLMDKLALGRRIPSRPVYVGFVFDKLAMGQRIPP